MNLRLCVAQFSRRVARVEMAVACGILVVLVALLMASVAFRAAGEPIFWVDEAMTNLLCAMALFGMSAMVREALHPRVDIIVSFASPRWNRTFEAIGALATLIFALVLVWLSLRLYQPLAMLRAGFDIQAFTDATRNFTYQEPSSTLGIARFWMWLPVPLAALGMALHAAAILAHPRQSVLMEAGRGPNDGHAS